MTQDHHPTMRRRDLLALIGATAGADAMYQAMTALGHAAESAYAGPLKLDGDVKGASVLVLGAGLAGLVASYELGKAGYRVQVLEYNARAGGRCRTLRGGDAVTELGGITQRCAFDEGLYFNPGPWRIPYHHRGILDYCKRLGVALEPFVHANNNAYWHAKDAFGGKPQRFRHVESDFQGYAGELLAKALNAGALDSEVSREDKERLFEALRLWGALDGRLAYRKGPFSSIRRGYAKAPGGGLSGEPDYSDPMSLSDVLTIGLWGINGARREYDDQSTLFQPVGGMDMIARAFAREVGNVIRFNSKVTAIKQDGNGVTAVFEDTGGNPGRAETLSADWCLCTIPLSILSRMEIDVGAPMKSAIAAIPYNSSVKVGLQFKRRFWEDDEAIYGGITYTDLPIRQIGYPNNGYHAKKGVLLGAYPGGANGLAFSALSPDERVKRALDDGAQIHPQYREEFETGVSVAWLREPSALGCFGIWSEEARVTHYKTLCAFDGRVLIAGEHASYVNAWQEGAVLSALDAIARLHKRVVAG